MKLLHIFVDLQYSDHKSWMGEIKLMLFLIYVLILGSKVHIMWSGCKRDIYYILFTKWRYSEFSNFADCDSYITKFNLEVAIRIWEPILFDTFNNISSSECKMSFLLQTSCSWELIAFGSNIHKGWRRENRKNIANQLNITSRMGYIDDSPLRKWFKCHHVWIAFYWNMGSCSHNPP